MDTRNTLQLIAPEDNNKKLDRIITIILTSVVAYIAIRISTLEMFILLRDSDGLVFIAKTLIGIPFYVSVVLTGGTLGFFQGIIDPILATIFYGFIFYFFARGLRRWTNKIFLIHLIQFVFVVFLVFALFPIIHNTFSQAPHGLDAKDELLRSKVEKCLTGESQNSINFGKEICFSSEMSLLKESRSGFNAERLIPICNSLPEEHTVEVEDKSFPGYEPLSFREYCFFALYEEFQPALTFWSIENSQSEGTTKKDIISDYNMTLGESLIFSHEADSPAWENRELAEKLLQEKICAVAGKNSTKINATERCLGYMSASVNIPYVSEFSRSSNTLTLIRGDAEEKAAQENGDCVSTLVDYTESWTQRRCIVENRGAFHIYFISESILSGVIGEKWKPKSAQFEQAPGTTTPSSIQFVYDVEGSQRGGEVPAGVMQIVEKQKGQIDFDAYLAATKNGSDITENINHKYKNDSNFSYQREIKREQIDGIMLFFDQIKRSDGKIFEPALVFQLGDTDIAINGAHAEALDQDELRTYMLAFARSLIQSE